jgi:hypothetical protein
MYSPCERIGDGAPSFVRLRSTRSLPRHGLPAIANGPAHPGRPAASGASGDRGVEQRQGGGALRGGQPDGVGRGPPEHPQVGTVRRQGLAREAERDRSHRTQSLTSPGGHQGRTGSKARPLASSSRLRTGSGAGTVSEDITGRTGGPPGLAVVHVPNGLPELPIVGLPDAAGDDNRVSEPGSPDGLCIRSVTRLTISLRALHHPGAPAPAPRYVPPLGRGGRRPLLSCSAPSLVPTLV